MIIQLSVNNVALIKQLITEIPAGMTVLTGETGAGKSIIIDSINMILGDRTNRELVRYEEKKAVVQAVFEISDALAEELAEHGIEAEDNQLIITREVTSEGKSICRMNGSVVTLAQLRSFAPHLVNIHGQHDNQALLDPKKHMSFVDKFGKAEDVLNAYKAEYGNYRDIQRQIERLNLDEAERLNRMDLLSYQINELEKAKLSVGEEEDLKEQRDIIANAEAISTGSKLAYENLYGGAEVQAAYDGISIAVSKLEELRDYSPQLAELTDTLTNVMYTVEEAAHEINDYSMSIEYDEEALNDVEARLDVLSRIKRKYGGTVESAIDYLEEITQEYEKIQNSEELSKELFVKLAECEKRLEKSAADLRAKREKASKMLEEEVKSALADLDMGSCDFVVKTEKTSGFTSDGTETAEFFISTNPGEIPKPLEKVASGGELSRVMLAMKSVLADSDNVDTLIFDEIDTGVSGRAAQKIAVKLSEIGKNKQVICISHSPQIAAMGDNHFYVSKSVVNDKTETSLKILNDEERCTEIARITDGELTGTSLAHAKEMLERARGTFQN